ncbi:hypothetical protein AKJ50_02175, partial [candidate division MSBL1 archaeon SCGC-AAA382A13]
TGSPYGKFGGVRSVFTTMSELPLLGVGLALIYFKTGNLMLPSILEYQAAHGPLIAQVPLAFVAVFVCALSKLKYSPFAIIYGKDIVTGYQTEHYGVLRSALLTGESLMIFTWITLLVAVFFGTFPLWAMIIMGVILLVAMSFIAGTTPLLAPHHSIQFQGALIMTILAISLIIEMVI